MRFSAVIVAAAAVSGVSAATKKQADGSKCANCADKAGALTGTNTCKADQACAGASLVCQTTANSIASGADCSAATAKCADSRQKCGKDPNADSEPSTDVCYTPTKNLAADKYCNAENTCTAGTECYKSAGSIDLTWANRGQCKGLDSTATVNSGSDLAGATWPMWRGAAGQHARKACAADNYAGADGSNVNQCETLKTGNNKLCLTTVAPSDSATFTASGCGASHFCIPTAQSDYSATKVAANGATTLTLYPGVCKTKTASDSGKCYFDSQCTTGHYCNNANPSVEGDCADNITAKTAAAGKKAVTDNDACNKAVTAFGKLHGHGFDAFSEVKTGTQGFQGNCGQIVEVEGKYQVVHANSTPGTAKTTTAAAECGFCSDKCVGAALQVKEKCLDVSAVNDELTTGPLIFFTAVLPGYVAAVSHKMSVPADNACHAYSSELLEARGAKYTYGCASEDTYPKTTGAATTTAALIADKDITTWVGKCAVAYGSSGAAAQFGSSLLLVTLSLMSLLA